MKIIKEKVTGKEKLLKNEYFVLMVTDHENKNRRPKKDYIDFSKGFIGIERTTEGNIYISKDYSKREAGYRGDVCIVEVDKKDKICLLD